MVGIAIGVAVLIYAAPSAGGSFGELFHAVCSPGALVANETLWIPQLIINAPYGGYANGSYTQLDPSGNAFEQESTGASNGNTTISAVKGQWLVFLAHTGFALGPGANAPCQGPYVAQQTGPMNSYIIFELSKPSAVSDRGLPSNFTTGVSPGPVVGSVVFDAAYQTPTEATEEICGGPGQAVWSTHSEIERFTVPFMWKGVREDVTTTVAALANYTYSTQAPGLYSAEDLGSQPNGFGSGLTFDYQPCP